MDLGDSAGQVLVGFTKPCVGTFTTAGASNPQGVKRSVSYAW